MHRCRSLVGTSVDSCRRPVGPTQSVSRSVGQRLTPYCCWHVVAVRSAPRGQRARAGRGRCPAPRRPRGTRRGGPGTLSAAQGLDQQDTRQVGPHRTDIRIRRPGTPDRQDVLLLLLLGVRVPISADGRLLQADGYEP